MDSGAQSAPQEVADSCELCGDPIELDSARSLQLRHSSSRDTQALRALYERLSPSEVTRRFFSGGLPPDEFFEKWAGLAERGGLCLVAELTSADGHRIIAEAGYSTQADGDVELGMAVDPDHRGWISAWILDALLRHAHERGFQNMQALVKTENAGMRALINHRGCAVLDHPDWGSVHLTMATEGPVPSWPPGTAGRRVLIESDRSRWPSEAQLQAKGAAIAICTGLNKPTHRCPVLEGEPCPLVEGADAVIVDFAESDPRLGQLTAAEDAIHPEANRIAEGRPPPSGLPNRTETNELIARIIDQLDLGGSDKGAAS